LVVCLVLLASGAPGWAQAPPQPDQPSVYQLTLEAVPEIKNGRIAAVQGTASAAGERLMLGGLSILQPVAISLVAQFPTDDLRIELSKFTTDAPVRSGSTKGEGVCTFQFRTEGDVQIKVISPGGPKPFRLVAWAGDEVAAELPPVFAPVKTDVSGPSAAPAASEGTPVVLWVIAGGIILCAGLLAIIVLKRRSS
jgi:hypothetical protein